MLPAPIVPLAEVALIDAAAVDMGCQLPELMQAAGRVVADRAQAMAPTGRILVVCGGGNNGGDGYVAARSLAEAGRDVELWAVQEPGSELSRAVAAELPETVARLDGPPEDPPALIIDAILGAGVTGPPRDPVPAVLNALRALDRPCLAVDAPTGAAHGQALPHCRCVTFQVDKRELAAACEEPPEVVDIGIPDEAITHVNRSCLRRFPALRADAHKGNHGELLVVGGGPFPGALHYASRAALFTGLDLVHALTAGQPDLPPNIVRHVHEGRNLVPTSTEVLSSRLARSSAVLIGPGAGRAPRTDDALRQVFDLAADMGIPMVIDADGLTALARPIREHPADGVPLIITPHAGELRHIFGRKVDDAEIHAFARDNRLVCTTRHVDLLTDGSRWQRNHLGNPRMAVGGTGDLLAGLTAGFLARECEPFDAARLALYWLSTTADACWQDLGPCYLPEDILATLADILRTGLTALGDWPPVSA